MDWKCSKNKSYAKTICKVQNHAESFAMLHFSHCEKENLVILMMRVRQNNPAYNTAADIVRIRKSTKSHVWTSLKVLEDRGFIEKRIDKDNKKHVTIHLLQLTNEGIEDGIQAQKEFAQDMFDGLSEKEIRSFMNVFQKVYDNAERMISNEKNS